MSNSFEDHIKRMTEIQQSGIDFFRKVSEHHVEIVERKIDSNLKVAKRLFGMSEESEDEQPEKTNEAP